MKPPMKKVRKFFSEVKEEMKKVTWPKGKEVTKLTLIVLIISGIIALYVGILDFTFTKLLEFLLSV